jgi:hypothetical protein
MRARGTLLSLLVLLSMAAVLRADPPDRVARLGYFTGSVSYRSASLDDWTAADANYPLTVGDHLWFDDDARGELQVGGSTLVRFAPNTGFSFLNLDDQTAQMRISEGALAVTVSQLDQDEVVEIDTPSAAVSLLQPGFYRIEVNSDGTESRVTVRHGQAEITVGGAAVPVRANEVVVISGLDSPQYDVREATGPDSWEQWASDRDVRSERAESRQYVSQDVVGSEDLDSNGTWQDDAEYGHVWSPSHVEVDWAPYRYGRWSWVDPWGWTWVDDASWGFAPFHYGRWAHRDRGWFWVPGERVGRAVYAPALVAFVGGNDFASVSVGVGGVGWFALGPREVYVPPYHTSAGYIRNVNVRSVTNITQINVTNINVTNVNYVNRGVRGGVTVVNHDTFVGGRAVNRAAVVVSPQVMARASVRATVVADIKPQRASIVGESTKVVKQPPRAVQERAVVTRVAAPAPRAHIVETGRPVAPAPKTLVKQAPVTFKPVRQGLPEAHPVKVGERPRPIVGGDKGSPSGPATNNKPGSNTNDRPGGTNNKPGPTTNKPGPTTNKPGPTTNKPPVDGRTQDHSDDRPGTKSTPKPPPPPVHNDRSGDDRPGTKSTPKPPPLPVHNDRSGDDRPGTKSTPKPPPPDTHNDRSGDDRPATKSTPKPPPPPVHNDRSGDDRPGTKSTPKPPPPPVHNDRSGDDRPVTKSTPKPPPPDVHNDRSSSDKNDHSGSSNADDHPKGSPKTESTPKPSRDSDKSNDKPKEKSEPKPAATPTPKSKG